MELVPLLALAAFTLAAAIVVLWKPPRGPEPAGDAYAHAMSVFTRSFEELSIAFGAQMVSAAREASEAIRRLANAMPEELP